MNNDPENFIFTKFSELKRQVDLDRENAKLEIDQLADGILENLALNESELKTECKSEANSDYYTELINDMKKKVEDFEKCLSSLKYTKEDRDNQSEYVNAAIEFLDDEIEEYEIKLFRNKLIKYEPMKDGMSDVFGKLTVEVVHFSVTCDSCEAKDFSSKRYKCLMCDDYDLCENCFKTRRTSLEHKLDHPMVRYDKPDQILDLDMKEIQKLDELKLESLAEILKNDIHSSIDCRVCKKKPLTGVRLKCDTCFDYSLCLECFGRKGLSDNHSFSQHPVVVEKN